MEDDVRLDQIGVARDVKVARRKHGGLALALWLFAVDGVVQIFLQGGQLLFQLGKVQVGRLGEGTDTGGVGTPAGRGGT